MNINLHIERLIVDDLGIQPQQREELKAAVAAALKQQLISQGTAFSLQSHASRSSVSAGSFLVENSEGMDSLGQRNRHADFGSISQQ
jgi:hypothetical protein